MTPLKFLNILTYPYHKLLCPLVLRLTETFDLQHHTSPPTFWEYMNDSCSYLSHFHSSMYYLTPSTTATASTCLPPPTSNKSNRNLQELKYRMYPSSLSSCPLPAVPPRSGQPLVQKLSVAHHCQEDKIQTLQSGL